MFVLVFFFVQKFTGDFDLEPLVSSTTAISQIRRLGTHACVKIIFHGESLPATIKIGLVRHQVRPLVPRPLECGNCLKIGQFNVETVVPTTKAKNGPATLFSVPPFWLDRKQRSRIVHVFVRKCKYVEVWQETIRLTRQLQLKSGGNRGHSLKLTNTTCDTYSTLMHIVQ